MRNVSAFIQRLDQMPAAEVKVAVRRYAADLHSANPLECAGSDLGIPAGRTDERASQCGVAAAFTGCHGHCSR